jgi:hypothetical protein
MEDKKKEGCDDLGILDREKITINKGGESQERQSPIQKETIKTDHGTFKTK